MGIFIAVTVITIWSAHLYYTLNYVAVDLTSPFYYLHIFIQGYSYTGLFITGHDGMHGNISKIAKVNHFFGRIAAFLFAGLSYKKLLKNHFLHHKHPGEKEDPDFYIESQNFFAWWFIFLKRYTTIMQLIIMAVIFNILKIWFNDLTIISFWVLPAFIGTFQLFYFGTYRPHKYPHLDDMQPHNARTQRKNHLWAMISCYFFGYHHEHHDSPKTPWWQLYKLK